MGLPNPAYITNTYDNMAQLSSTVLKKGDDITILDTATYGYATNDLRTDFTYDGLGRLRERLECVWVAGGAGPLAGTGWTRGRGWVQHLCAAIVGAIIDALLEYGWLSAL
jgi:hypothetical protein